MGRKSLADQRRNQIIEAFYRCVVADGFGGASIRTVAAEAGVTPSTLHHYFKDRNEMIEALVHWFTGEIFRRFEETVANLDDPARRMATGIEFIFSSQMINPDDSGFFLECCAEARHNPRVRQTIAELFGRFRRGIVRHLDENDAFSGLSEAKKQVLAATIVAVHEGIEMQWFADPEAVSLTDTLEATRGWIRFFVAG